jgi:ABC-type glycerol-3-phosphate transport system substrate-binding protein
MLDGDWQASLSTLSQEEQGVNYGVAPVPAPSVHPERASTSVIYGPVVFIPAGAMDKEAAANLLAWIMSPEIVAEEAYATSSLPTSRIASQDPRFQEAPHLEVFLDLMAHPNARTAATTPISSELNESLDQVEAQLLHNGGDAVLLLDEVQAELAPRLEEALGFHGRP